MKEDEEENDDAVFWKLSQPVTLQYFNKYNCRFERDFKLTYYVLTKDLQLIPNGSVRVIRPQAQSAAQ